MHGLYVIGLLATTFMKLSAEEPELGVAATSDILCFPIDGPATFDCMATVAAGRNPRDVLYEVVLKTEQNPFQGIPCTQGIGFERRWNYSWIGPVNSSWTEPMENKMNCTFEVDSIRDLNVTCAAKSSSSSVEKSFSILTTKSPEKLFISQVEQENASIIEIEEGTNATINCTAVRSKPGLILSWNPPVESESSLTLLTDERGITTTSISSLVTGSRDLHWKQLTCIGRALPCITASATMTATATFKIIYGPYELKNTTEQNKSNVKFTCPLISNPSIETYNWSQDGLILNCSEKACQLSAGTSKTTITCTGSNPKSSTIATATIDITWIDVSTPLSLETTHSSHTNPGNPGNNEGGQGGLTDAELAGIIVAALLVVAAVIIIPIIYKKKKKSMGNDGCAIYLGRSSKTDASIGQIYDRPYNDPKQATKGSTGTTNQESGISNKAAQTSDNNIDNTPRSRNPIAMHDVSLDDLVQNPLYS